MDANLDGSLDGNSDAQWQELLKNQQFLDFLRRSSAVAQPPLLPGLPQQPSVLPPPPLQRMATSNGNASSSNMLYGASLSPVSDSGKDEQKQKKQSFFEFQPRPETTFDCKGTDSINKGGYMELLTVHRNLMQQQYGHYEWNCPLRQLKKE